MVQDTGVTAKIERAGKRSPAFNAALLFAFVFAQSCIATVEVVAISRLEALEAGFWATLNAACYICATIIIIDEKNRKIMIPVYILAFALATIAGTLLGKRLV